MSEKSWQGYLISELDLELNPDSIPRRSISPADTNTHLPDVKLKEKQLTENKYDVSPSNVISIIEAKHEWESTVDGINQLAIILLDKNLNIIRANKTIENWGWSTVNSVIGLSVSELVEPIISPRKHDEFYRVWLNLDASITTEWESRYNSTGRIYRFSFYPIKRTGKYDNKCFLALVIEDITEKKQAVVQLKNYVSELELQLISKNQKLRYAKKNLEQKLKKEALAIQKLEDSEEQLHQLSNQLITAQEKERKNVSRELHDGIGQILSAIKYQIEGALLANKTTNDNVALSTSNYTLEEVLGNVKAAFVEVRRVSMNLRPSMLDEHGIITTLEWFFRDFNKVYNNLVIDPQISLSENDIPEKSKIVIFRIVQESMNNIAKYAHATQIRIQLFRKDNYHILRVIDDGKGFDIKTIEQQRKFGLGLKSMKERADSINGKLTIHSRVNTGTTIELKFSPNT